MMSNHSAAAVSASEFSFEFAYPTEELLKWLFGVKKSTGCRNALT